MISDQSFSSNFTSVWHEIIPLADNYWRRENLKISRNTLPVENLAPVQLRGFLNELAFETFCCARSMDVIPHKNEILEIAGKNIKNVADYIFRITKDKNSINLYLDDICQNEVFELTRNLMLTFPDKRNFISRPKFEGCGLVSACEGDLIYGDCLYEIKAGDRKFRVGDIKQLLIYSSMAFAKGDLKFSKIGLFNPRNGYLWSRSLDVLCIELSGTRESDVLANVVKSMTHLAVSR